MSMGKVVSLIAAEGQRVQTQTEIELQAIIRDLYGALEAQRAQLQAQIDQLRNDLTGDGR
jgi:uncharacterized protein involved in exopolysaccharide biosynthesis